MQKTGLILEKFDPDFGAVVHHEGVCVGLGISTEKGRPDGNEETNAYINPYVSGQNCKDAVRLVSFLERILLASGAEKLGGRKLPGYRDLYRYPAEISADIWNQLSDRGFDVHLKQVSRPVSKRFASVLDLKTVCSREEGLIVFLQGPAIDPETTKDVSYLGIDYRPTSFLMRSKLLPVMKNFNECLVQNGFVFLNPVITTVATARRSSNDPAGYNN